VSDDPPFVMYLVNDDIGVRRFSLVISSEPSSFRLCIIGNENGKYDRCLVQIYMTDL
jgi:hypothetical protein